VGGAEGGKADRKTFVSSVGTTTASLLYCTLYSTCTVLQSSVSYMKNFSWLFAFLSSPVSLSICVFLSLCMYLAFTSCFFPVSLIGTR
jgi:hypothetical protein